jgi:hypothetical protein
MNQDQRVKVPAYFADKFNSETTLHEDSFPVGTRWVVMFDSLDTLTNRALNFGGTTDQQRSEVWWIEVCQQSFEVWWDKGVNRVCQFGGATDHQNFEVW